ncbi:hypothetical protein [Streptomyces kanamyceticus]|uniref:Uncharacterized protein n=1 Tax=Streptomyces kanamyceticus TaxID=1967 RepID=A0A5J6G321_STRKN|nr:hypothetical protein [Streptomyces kanamyceticus]QEU89979.1 hypothetical protein CP970_02810 [Streptomyces kanamyceticus]
MTQDPTAPISRGGLGRRSFLKATGVAALAVGAQTATTAAARAATTARPDADATVVHTLVFSFPGTMPKAQQDAFYAELRDVVMGSGLALSVDHKPHLPLPDDANAPVFVSSGIAELRCKDLATLERLTGYQPLNDFRTRWQAKYPYQVVWTNHQALAV